MTAAELRAWRERTLIGEHAMTIPQLARLLGVKEAKVQDWEAGERRIPGPVDKLLRVVTVHPPVLQTLLWLGLSEAIQTALDT